MGAEVMDKCVVGYVHDLPSVVVGKIMCRGGGGGDLMKKKSDDVFDNNVTGMVLVTKKKMENGDDDACSDNESSSIGKNSDLSENSLEKPGDGDDEVQSSYKENNNKKNSPFDEAIVALEEALPMRKSMSRYYNGKSRSFTSLADASRASSIKEIAKPDNAFTRKRRNLLAHKMMTWGDRARGSPLRGSAGGGISKRVTGSSRSTLALAVAMNNSEREEGTAKCDGGGSFAVSSQVKDFCYWKSFSYADLQQCVSGVANNCSNSN